MSKFKSSALCIVVPSTFVMHFMNGAKNLNATSVARFRPIIVIFILTKCEHYCNLED